jgi:flagellar basal body-associated protein FliL
VTTAGAPAQPTGGSSALKIVLIVVAVIIVIGIIGIAGVGFVGYRIAKSAHVQQKGDSVKVETPIGTFSANDPDQAVKDLGVDVYPGAQVQKEGTASVTFGSIHTVTANFLSDDSLDKVCEFYRSKFPTASVNTSDQNHCTVVTNDKMNSVTVNADASGSGTKFQIAAVTKK